MKEKYWIFLLALITLISLTPFIYIELFWYPLLMGSCAIPYCIPIGYVNGLNQVVEGSSILILIIVAMGILSTNIKD